MTDASAKKNHWCSAPGQCSASKPSKQQLSRNAEWFPAAPLQSRQTACAAESLDTSSLIAPPVLPTVMSADEAYAKATAMMEKDEIFEGPVISVNRGGLVVDCWGAVPGANSFIEYSFNIKQYVDDANVITKRKLL